MKESKMMMFGVDRNCSAHIGDTHRHHIGDTHRHM